jgi:hypothetical protein
MSSSGTTTANNSKELELLQRVALLEKLAAKLMMENDKLVDKVAYLEHGDMPTESSAVHTIRSDVEATLTEVLNHFHTTTLLVEQGKVEANAEAEALEASKQGSSKDKNKAGNDSGMVALMSGDFICLRHDGV